jgi:hypothetical protein
VGKKKENNGTYQVKLNNDGSMEIAFSYSLPKKKTFDWRCAKTRNDDGEPELENRDNSCDTKGHEGYRINLQTNSVRFRDDKEHTRRGEEGKGGER